MKRRLFIAINLPGSITDAIQKELQKTAPLLPKDARIMLPENWHITISFLGWQDEEKIPAIERAMEIGNQFPKPDISFENIIFGPAKNTPRMLWLTATPETSRDLGSFKNRIESELTAAGLSWERDDYRPFSGHITLARFEPKNGLKPVKIFFNRGFTPEKFYLMESKLYTTGPVYTALKEIDFS